MDLHYVNRKQYHLKNESSFLKELRQQFGDVYILPEGGSNTLALRGCEEVVSEIEHTLKEPFDVICCACGTGATLAGLITAIKPTQKAIGFSALKGGEFLADDVNLFLKKAYTNNPKSDLRYKDNWAIESRFHFGGYAKVNEDLITFMHSFQKQFGFALDAVYTAKMFFGLFELIKMKTFCTGSTIVAIHSGGLQGNKGFNLQTHSK